MINKNLSILNDQRKMKKKKLTSKSDIIKTKYFFIKIKRSLRLEFETTVSNMSCNHNNKKKEKKLQDPHSRRFISYRLKQGRYFDSPASFNNKKAFKKSTISGQIVSFLKGKKNN